MASKEIIPFEPSTLENIDKAVYDFVNETLNIYTTTNSGWTKVPVLWLGTERAYQIKNDKELRDKVGKLKLPLITITRTNIVRDEMMGSYQSYYPSEAADGGVVAVTKVINQRKTRNFANADANRESGGSGSVTPRVINRKIVYETITVPKPTYVTCMFEINIRSEYQQQMNDILPPLVIDQKNIYKISNNEHSYELFIQDDYGLASNLANLAQDERMFTAKIQFKVLGYLVGDAKNNEKPQIVRRENAVEVRISRERVIVGDKRPWAKDDGKYREF